MTAPLDVTLDSQSHASARQAKVGIGFKLFYGAGALGDGVTNTALNFFLLFYLTSVCGLSGTVAGTALLLGLVIDAVADPVIGLLSDNTRSRFGRRLPYIVLSTLPLAVSFALLFSIPANLSQTALVVYAVGCGLALRLGLSFFILPYTSVGAEVTDNYEDRSSIVSYRVSFSMIGTFLAIALGLGVFMTGPNGLLNRSAYAGFGSAGAAIIILAGVCAAIATRRALPRLHKAEATGDVAPDRFVREILGIFRSPSFVVLFIGTIAFCIGQGMAGAMAIHLNHYFWKLPTSSVQLVLLALAVGPLLGAPITALLGKRIEKKPLAIGSMMVFVFAPLWPPLAAIAGLMPTDPEVLLPILLVNSLVTGAGLIGGAICAQSMMADAADEYEFLFGARREGLFYAGLSFAFKTASGIGGFLAGIALDLIHFPAKEVAGGADVILTQATHIGLGLVAGPLPALITLLGPIALFFYGLTRRKHQAILTELERRRACR
ncbi:MFS transporter [soil metagenome]